MASAQSSAPASKPPALPFPLQDGESVTTIERRHWIYLWPMISAQFLAGVLPVALLGFLLDSTGAFGGIVTQGYMVLSAMWLIYWVVRVILTWYRYRNDIWVITNQRLIDSYRRHPFHLSISTADLVNVQDMTIGRSGILKTMLDFGNVVCQTASIDQDFMITGVPDPRGIQALVDRERDRERSRLRTPQA